MISVNNKKNSYLKACFNGDYYLTKKLLDKLTKNDIENIRDENRASCIHYAARKGHVKILEYLIINKQVNPGLQSSVGATILHDAAANGRIETIEWILKNTNMKIKARDINGATVLHLAAKYGQRGFIEWYFRLFSYDDAFLQTINGTTPLHFACASGSMACVKLIASSAPDTVNMKTKHGLTPLYLAVQGKYLDIVKMLALDFKANIFERDNDGMSLLHVACQNGCLDVLKWLVETQRFDINDRDSIGATGLHYSCSNGHSSLVFYLLSKNASILCDYEGGTPLHDCAANNEIECARLLLTNNCDVNKFDNTNLTAYEIACNHGFSQLAGEIKLVRDQQISKSTDVKNNLIKTDSVNSRYVDIDSVNNDQLSNKYRSGSVKTEGFIRRSRTNEPRDSTGKYYLIQEEEFIIENLDRVLDLYDDVDNGSDIASTNGKTSVTVDTDTDTSSYIDLNNPKYGCNCNSTEEQQVTRQSSLSVVEYEAENPSSNRSTWFPSPPNPDDELINIQYRSSDRSDSIENARLSSNTLTSSASPTLSFKDYNSNRIDVNRAIISSIPTSTNIPEALKLNSNEMNTMSSLTINRTDSLKPGNVKIKREISFMAELSSRINNNMISLKKVPSVRNTIYQQTTNDDEQQNKEIQNVENDELEQEEEPVVIPPWKKELIEKKKDLNNNKKINLNENNKKQDEIKNSKPQWLTELAIKKKENLIKKVQE